MRYRVIFLFLITQIVCAQEQVRYEIAQEKVRYEISFDNALHHEALITATFPGVGTQPLAIRMSRSSPGRYALHEFAKHVYSLTATDSKDKPLPVTRPDPYGWTVTGHDGTVIIRYTLFGNRADGTYTGITSEYAHLNMPATFVWAKGLENRPVEVTFRLPAGKDWKIATQLKPMSGTIFWAPHLQYFMDSPTHMGNFFLQEWKVDHKGKTATMQFAIHHEGTEAEADAFVDRTKKVVQEEMAVFGELPDYDFGRYTFIAAYLPWVDGDGMEHRNSTFLTSQQPLLTGATNNLGTVSHEFFHAWNVERIRPKSLEPFDFERANMSGELWFAEGFTNYYGHLVLARTRDYSLNAFAQLTGANLNRFLNSPGRDYFSAVGMSQQAPFVDAAVAIEPNNRANTYISYYLHGEVIALALDLTLRQQFKDITLDSYMRRVWEKYGKTEKPYVIDDLRLTLGEVTGNQSFADNFFTRYIVGKEAAPYETLLRQAGFLLRKANPGKASLGSERLTYTDQGAMVVSQVLVNSPLYKAGLEQGDIILTINGKSASAQHIGSIPGTFKPGDKAEVTFTQMGKRKTSTVTFAEDPQLEVVTAESTGSTVTKTEQQFRQWWLKAQ